MRTWLWFSATLSAISSASFETEGKNVYIATSSWSLTSIGCTQPHVEPGGVYVNGSVHVIDEQSTVITKESILLQFKHKCIFK